MTDRKDAGRGPHLYGTADPESREAPPANGLRGEGAATPLASNVDDSAEDPDAPNKQGR